MESHQVTMPPDTETELLLLVVAAAVPLEWPEGCVSSMPEAFILQRHGAASPTTKTKKEERAEGATQLQCSEDEGMSQGPGGEALEHNRGSYACIGNHDTCSWQHSDRN
uniref:Uncharacterized protein n=1 Tax=Sphaerodactylus townsendi TaxID=933632 RepID=A0ACB8F4F7_9SAUR